MLVANRKNLKLHAKELLGNAYTPEKERELINVCTKKTVNDYHDGTSHISFAEAAWMKEIDKVLNNHGIESNFNNTSFLGIFYSNTGDSYATTILHYKGKLRIGCWADVAGQFLL